MIYNEWVSKKIGGRKAPAGGKVYLEQFNLNEWEDIEEIVDSTKVIKDIQKYDFDLENLEYLETKTTKSGLDFMIFEAGGDWEYPIWFFVYFDGKDLRGYVPTRGNMVNTLTKSAFGNGEDNDINGVNGDFAYFQKYNIKTINGVSAKKLNVDDFYDMDFDEFDIEKDLDMCIDEFEARVEIIEMNAKSPVRKRIKRVDDMPNPSNNKIDDDERMKQIDNINGVKIFYDLRKVGSDWLLFIGRNDKDLIDDYSIIYIVGCFIAQGVMPHTFFENKYKMTQNAGYILFRDRYGNPMDDNDAKELLSKIEEYLPKFNKVDGKYFEENMFN